MWNADYFSDLSILDWVGVALMAPLLLALGILLVYLVIGVIGSGPRRRRIAKQATGESEPAGDAKPSRSPRQMPGD